MFLVNARCHICFLLLTLLCTGVSALLGLRFVYFRTLAGSFVFNGAISSVQACFVDILLFAAIQLKYVQIDITAS